MYCVLVVFIQQWIESLYSPRVSDFLKMPVRGPQHNTHILQLPARDIPDWTFGLKMLLRYSSFPFWGRGSPRLECENQGWCTGPSWDSAKSHKSLQSPAIVCSQLESPPEGIFGHIEKPLNFLLQLRDPETALNDTEGQRVNGGHETPAISLRCPQGHKNQSGKAAGRTLLPLQKLT